RAGKVVGSMPCADANKARLAEMMIGEVLASPTPRLGNAGKPVLEVDDLTVRNPHGQAGLSGFRLNVRAGEIVGIAGVAGNGQDELAAAVTGLRRVDAGTIR